MTTIAYAGASFALLALWFWWLVHWRVMPCPNCKRRTFNHDFDDEWHGRIYHCFRCGYGNCTHSDHQLTARVEAARNQMPGPGL